MKMLKCICNHSEMEHTDTPNNIIGKFKILLLGDTRVGKTTMINRIKTGDFNKKYTPTVSFEENKLLYETDKGLYELRLWDCAGVDKLKGLGHGYYIQSDAVIYMFDCTNENTYKSLSKYISDYRNNMWNKNRPH
jgi:small GTP-binding protein